MPNSPPLMLFMHKHTHTHNHYMALFHDYPVEPVPEEIFFWTLWCNGR